MTRFITLFTLFLHSLFATEHEISIASIFQNEARFLDEWIRYHRDLGVTHFRLYNNNSTDDYAKVLQPWIESGIVHLVQWPHKPKDNDWKNFSFTVQTGAYNNAIIALRKKTKWLAIIDTDEFITPMGNEKLISILNKFPKKSAVYLNWCMYGTNGVWDCKGDLVGQIKRHAPKNLPVHLYCKSIVQPKYVNNCQNPHFCNLKGKLYNTDMEIVDPMHVKKVCWDVLRLNHYWTRDKRFMEEVKIPRRLRWNNSIDKILQAESLYNDVLD